MIGLIKFIFNAVINKCFGYSEVTHKAEDHDYSENFM